MHKVRMEINKKRLTVKSYITVCIFTASLVFCGCGQETVTRWNGFASAIRGELSYERDHARAKQKGDDKEPPVHVEYGLNGRQVYHETFDDPAKPEITEVRLSGICDESMESKVSISDLYRVDYLHSGVAGLVGFPVELDYSDVYKAELCFVYDPDELRGIPEDNLIMLHYNEEEMTYDTVENAALDKDSGTLSARINEGGVYLLADAYQWYGCWGMDVSGYSYTVDMTEYESDWERENDTGSIMILADKDWAIRNAPTFHVSTPEELASVVYYVNSSYLFEEISVILEKDIDLEGYAWMPMGWYGPNAHPFAGTVDGRGHTVNGMHIDVDYQDCGFIGYSTSAVMRDISFTNAYVHGTACTGIAGGEIYGRCVWDNVYTEGIIEGGGNDYGGIVGRETNIKFTDCTADVKANGDPFPYFSYRQMVIEETEVVETFHLVLNDDMTITRDDHTGFHNLGWNIEHDGMTVLERLAEDEYVLDTEYQWLDGKEGVHTVYLTAYINGTYIRVSNIIEYEL